MSVEARAYSIFHKVFGEIVDLREYDDEDVAKGIAVLAGELESAPTRAPNPNVPHIVTALGQFAKEAKDPEKGSKVSMKLRNGNKLEYDFANLQSAWPSLRRHLLELDLIGGWDIDVRDGVLFQVFTITSLIDGSIREGKHPFNYTGTDPQVSGSWDTYTRRYCLFSALGLAAGAKDDDGVAAKEASAHTPAKRRPIKQGPSTMDQLTAIASVETLNSFLSDFKGESVDIRIMPEKKLAGTLTWIQGKGAQEFDNWAEALEADHATPGDFI